MKKLGFLVLWVAFLGVRAFADHQPTVAEQGRIYDYMYRLSQKPPFEGRTLLKGHRCTIKVEDWGVGGSGDPDHPSREAARPSTRQKYFFGVTLFIDDHDPNFPEGQEEAWAVYNDFPESWLTPNRLEVQNLLGGGMRLFSREDKRDQFLKYNYDMYLTLDKNGDIQRLVFDVSALFTNRTICQ